MTGDLIGTILRRCKIVSTQALFGQLPETFSFYPLNLRFIIQTRVADVHVNNDYDHAKLEILRISGWLDVYGDAQYSNSVTGELGKILGQMKILISVESRDEESRERMELLVPTVSDIIFKYSWPVPHYKKTIAKSSSIDSSPFEVNVNGIHSSWNLSIRFWKGPEGKRITNPVVLCLNMLSCTVEEVEQAKIRFQFAVYNADVNHWEYCHVSRTILELKSTSDIISLGYRDLSIVDRHFKKNGEVVVMVKIQIIQCESEKHNLSQDMARLLKHPRAADTKLICGGTSPTEIPVHGSIIAARSNVLADMIAPLAEREDAKVSQDEATAGSSEGEKENRVVDNSYKYRLELMDLSTEVTQELLRYIYSDHVDNLDTLAHQLLSVAERFRLQGLKEACERNLIETITPENVATLLLISDEFSCDSLKRASLVYCEENAMSINKSFAWKIMEQVNPELFNEVCEAGMGSSRSSNIDDSELSN